MRPDIEPPGGIHFRRRHLLEPTGDLDAGMGMKDVEPPVSAVRRSDRCAERDVVGHIQGETLGLASDRDDLGRNGRRTLGDKIGDDDRCPRPCQCKRPCPADPRTGPCDEGDAIAEQHARPPHVSRRRPR
jgi:hypothetical protein